MTGLILPPAVASVKPQPDVHGRYVDGYRLDELGYYGHVVSPQSLPSRRNPGPAHLALRTEALHADAAQQAAASSAILMVMVLVFSLAARYLSYRIDKKMGGNK